MLEDHALVEEWQTRLAQTQEAERRCGFKSHLAHQMPEGSLGFHAGLAEWFQATVFQTVYGGSIPSIRTTGSSLNGMEGVAQTDKRTGKSRNRQTEQV